jgi:glycosyltransferase involved in cell wall biosynthesis
MHVILSRGFAGSERSTAESCNSQVRLGHEVMLVVRRSHRSHGQSIRDHLAPAVQVAEVNDRLFTQRQLRQAIEAFRPDVIHTHLRRASRLVARINPDAATIATLHLSVNGRHYLKLDGLICNARWQMRDIPATYRGLVFKADNSLVPHPRLPPETVQKLRAELGVTPEQYLIGGVGRLAYSKGWDVLIQAFKQAQLPNARCVILGEGRERRRLEKLADGAVSLPGFRSNVKDYYQAFDLFVCPSRREPLPRVILEALDAGVPVVASTADGCRELLEVYPGDLFPIEDVDALTRLLRHHYEARTPRREVDLSAHHLDTAARVLLERYAAVIEHHRQHAADRR